MKNHGKSPPGQEDTISVIIRHELGLDRLVSASSDSLFRSLRNPLPPFGL